MPEVLIPAVSKYGVRVFVGGCVDRGDGSSFRRKAHAHVEEPNKGWICVRSAKRLYVAGTERPSLLIWHEVAHCLVGPSNWHNDTWDRKRLSLIQENK